MIRQTTVRHARPGRFAAAVALIVAACSADPSATFAPGFAIDPPVGYPIGSEGNCLPNLTDPASRACWFSRYPAGTDAPDPLDGGDTDCRCVGDTSR